MYQPFGFGSEPPLPVDVDKISSTFLNPVSEVLECLVVTPLVTDYPSDWLGLSP